MRLCFKTVWLLWLSFQVQQKSCDWCDWFFKYNKRSVIDVIEFSSTIPELWLMWLIVRVQTKKHVCCRSSNLVYCLQCKICGIQYVGETLRPFRKRLYEHSRNILNGVLDDPIGAHFNSPGPTGHFDQIRAFVLSFITKPPKSKEANDMRKKFESRWVYKLRTSLPYGLNSKDWLTRLICRLLILYHMVLFF